MPEVLNLIQLIERLQQDFRSVINETKRKYIPVKDNAEAQSKRLKELVNGNQDIQAYLLEHNLEIASPFVKGCETGQSKIINICLTALQRLITSQMLTEASVEYLLKTISTLVISELEELKLLQTTILLVTNCQTLSDVSLSQALGICLRLHDSKTNAVVNTASAAIRQCTGSVFDQVNKGVLQSSKPETIETGEKTDVFHFTPASKSAFFFFQDLCLLTAGEIPHWLQGVESISPLLSLELIESVLSNYSTLFSKEKEFLFLLKERVCPLVIKLITSGLPVDSQKSTSRDSNIEGSSLGSFNTYSGPSDFGIDVRLNRIIILLCSKYFECLKTECEMLISTIMRIVENEQMHWRRALALEAMFKIIAQPELLLRIFSTFDTVDPPSRVFLGLVTTASGFIQAAFLTPYSYRDSVGSISGASQIVQKPAFIYRGASHIISDTQKFSLLEILDRHEVPLLPDGYSLRMTISCLLQFVWSLQHLIQQAIGSLKNPPTKEPPIEFRMLSKSWTALLPALSLLLEACSDEKLTDSFLLAESVIVVLSSRCGLTDAREAFLATLCKFSLPSLFVLSEKQGSKHTQYYQQTTDEATDRSPVVIVVNANHGPGNLSLEVAPSSGGSGNHETLSGTQSSGTSNGPPASNSLFITAKHIQISKALLEIAKTNGALLDSSWYLVLSTMQQLVWILGLKAAPTITTSATKSAAAGAESTPAFTSLDASFFENFNVPAVSTQGGAAVSKVIAELPVLSQTLSAIFEQSKNFDEVSLNFLIRALCSLAVEASEIANSNRDPSHFSIVKLAEVGLANLHRLDIWWKIINDQLLSICRVTHSELRQLAVNAILLLIRRTIMIKTPTTNFWNNNDLTSLVLEPLTQLTEIKFNDIQEKQLQCVQYLIHCYGDEINGSWLRLINIIGAISQSQSDKHIRSAFQCFQFVVTDYLPTLCPDCYPACVDTAAKFGHQEYDLNISLAAIGSLLHLTDFLFQRERGTVESAFVGKEDNETGGLWVSIFIHLADLVRDRRPAVRKSAGQTLFNAVECHSAQFHSEIWCQLIWTVFFPLLSDVQEKCARAPAGREGGTIGDNGSGSLLVHHSRDTAAKQWAETVVLTLSGVARCFVSKQSQLLALDRFPEAWERLLSNAERAVLTPNSEIAQNALSTLRILLDFNTEYLVDRAPSTWLAFWRTWVSIGRTFVEYFSTLNDSALTNGEVPQQQQSAFTRKSSTSTFGAEFFSLYFDLFPPLFPRIATKSFDSVFFAEFSEITAQGVLGPIFVSHHKAAHTSTTATPSFMTTFATNTVDEQGLTQTQCSVFNCLSLIAESIKVSETNARNLLVSFFELLLRLSLYAVRISRPGTSADLVEVIPMNYIIFAEKCMELATQLYKNFADSEIMCDSDGLLKIIEALRIPLAAKYKCQCRSTWLLASKCFIETVTLGVPIEIKQRSSLPKSTSNDNLWDMIFAAIRDFLFCQNQPTETLSGEEFQQHESLDCKYIDLICDLFLSRPEGMKPRFLEQLVGILGLGAMETSMTSADFALLDPNTLRLAPLSNPSDSQSKRPTLSMGVLQPFVHRSPSITAVSAVNNCPAVISTDGDLRPFVSREKFMRRCFEALLTFAFFSSPQETNSLPASLTLSIPGTNKPHIVLCRTVIRDVLDRCRFIFQRFVKSAQLTGKYPLPRARLSEVNFALQAVALLLTTFTTSPPHPPPPTHSSLPISIDASIWSYVIDIYPLVVDCIFVTEAPSQIFQGIHRLLQLYGRLLQPKTDHFVVSNTP